MNRSPLKVTRAMLDAGERAVQNCRDVAHDARATANLVFNAMLAESEWSPALRKRPRRYTADGKLLPKNPLTLADFDSEGKRLAGHMPDGRPIYQYARNFWYLDPKYTKT